MVPTADALRLLATALSTENGRSPDIAMWFCRGDAIRDQPRGAVTEPPFTGAKALSKAAATCFETTEPGGARASPGINASGGRCGRLPNDVGNRGL